MADRKEKRKREFEGEELSDQVYSEEFYETFLYP
jgi:hypothetical protein